MGFIQDKPILCLGENYCVCSCPAGVKAQRDPSLGGSAA